MKYLPPFFASLLVLAASGCGLLEGNKGGGDGDGDGGGRNACRSACAASAECTGEDEATCRQECNEARDLYPSCQSEFDTAFSCVDACDSSSISSCQSALESYTSCVLDEPGGGPGIGNQCSSQCQASASCTGEDATACTNECDTARASVPGCEAAFDAFLGCLDPCDDSSLTACNAQAEAYSLCLTDGPPTGTGGGPSTGTGGSPSVGTGGSFVVGTGGGPTTTGPASDFAYDGLGQTTNGWYGYLWTAVDPGGSITPAAGEGFVGPSLCAEGYTGASWAGYGMIGFNIAQDIDPDTLEGGFENEISVSGSGVSVSVQNRGGSGLRVQIQDNSNTDSGRWCADLPASGSGLIPWGNFNTQCWAPEGGVPNMGAYYAGEQISQVVIQAYASSDVSPTYFDFCVLSLDWY